MPRGDQTIRVLNILKHLLARRRLGATIDDLSKEYGSSPRTIYRDLDCLKAAGFEVSNVRIDGKVRWILKDPSGR